MGRPIRLAWTMALLAVTGCEQAPPDLFCGSSTPLASAEGSVFDPADVTGASANGTEATVGVRSERGDEATVRFAVDADAPPLLPTPGPAQYAAHQANCFGEGCDDAFWVLQDLDGVGYFEVGSLNSLDGAEAPRGDSHLRLGPAAAGDVCGDEALAVKAIVAGDDGEVAFVPGDHGDVVIDGHPWRVVVGSASRSSFVQTETQCADCAGPGVHTELRVDAVLYRRQE